MKYLINEIQILDISMFNKKNGKTHKCLADPGEARGCSTNTLQTDWLIHKGDHPFPPLTLQRGHAQIVIDRSSSYIGLGHSKL